MADPKRKTRKGKKVVRIPLTIDQQQKAEQLVADSLKDNPDIFNLPESKRSIDDLTDYYAKTIEGSTRILPKEKRRYVIYLRKSTDDEAKQVRSLEDQDVTQYFARPHTPKDKPHVENLIGKLQQECLDEDRSAKTVPELQVQINRWLNDYHFFRPHQALNYLTPNEYKTKLQHKEVALM